MENNLIIHIGIKKYLISHVIGVGESVKFAHNTFLFGALHTRLGVLIIRFESVFSKKNLSNSNSIVYFNLDWIDLI